MKDHRQDADKIEPEPARVGQRGGHIRELELLARQDRTDPGGVRMGGDKNQGQDTGQALEEKHPVPEVVVVRKIVFPPIDDDQSERGVEQDGKVDATQFDQVDHGKAGQKLRVLVEFLRRDKGVGVAKKMLQQENTNGKNARERLNPFDPKRTGRTHCAGKLVKLTCAVNWSLYDAGQLFEL